MMTLTDAALRGLSIEEEFDIQPCLDRGLWGLRLQRYVIAALAAKYGKIGAVRFLHRYPTITETAELP